MSPVTDWRQYDTIYTERYMWTPEENKEGYKAGSALTYADKLKGRLMLYYGKPYGLTYRSNEYQGTTVSIRIDKKLGSHVAAVPG